MFRGRSKKMPSFPAQTSIVYPKTKNFPVAHVAVSRLRPMNTWTFNHRAIGPQWKRTESMNLWTNKIVYSTIYAILIDVTDSNLTVPLTASVFLMRICEAALNEQTTPIATYSNREFKSNKNHIFHSLDVSILGKLHNIRWNIWFRDIPSYRLHSKVSAMIPPHPGFHQ